MQKHSKEKTKVVVRRLPPALSEDSFKTVLDKHVEGKYDWMSYFPGKVSLRKVVFSRAYVNFISPEYVYEFKAKFDGHVFVSNKGNQYKCAVEYAPFQKVPKPITKKDHREGTIEKDADYQEFVKMLEQGPELLPSAVHQLEKKEAEDKASGDTGKTIIVTPLMEYLRQKYANGTFKRGFKPRGRDGGRFAADREAKKAAAQEPKPEAPVESKGRKKGKGKEVKVKDAAQPAAVAATSDKPEKPSKKHADASKREASAPKVINRSDKQQEPTASKAVLVQKAEKAVTAALTKTTTGAPAGSDPDVAAAGEAASNAVAAAVAAATKPLTNRKVRAGYQMWVPSVMKTGHSTLEADGSKPVATGAADKERAPRIGSAGTTPTILKKPATEPSSSTATSGKGSSESSHQQQLSQQSPQQTSAKQVKILKKDGSASATATQPDSNAVTQGAGQGLQSKSDGGRGGDSSVSQKSRPPKSSNSQKQEWIAKKPG